MQNALTYSYDPAGNVLTYNQGYYSTTYGYDGADQLVSETSGGPYPPPALGFTYDHNGNRLSQTSGGQLTQSFTYDAHDKLTWGTAGNETDGYDQNGNETSINISGTAIALAYDDEDRLTQFTSSGATDTFTYNGLGLRVGKTDSTGTYSYVCDGADPGSPVLSDGHAVYTPGLSENRAGVSSFYSFDKQGNLWTVDGNSKNQLAYEDFAGFGTITAGGAATPFKFGGGNGCQSDADTGLVLMGHRYYDSRIGRFISQDPAKNGGNWYAYAGNNPVNKTDPSGLRVIFAPKPHDDGWGIDPGGLFFGGSGILDAVFAAADANDNYDQAQKALADTIALAQKKATDNDGQSVNLYLGMVFDFLTGTGASVRNYGPDSTQVLTFLQSMDAKDIFEQLADQGFSKNALGGVGHIAAFMYSIGDPMNGSQGHMGAFDWYVQSQSGNNLNVVVSNGMSRASFLGGNAFGFGVSNPASGPQRTITEYLHFTVPIPRR